MGLGFSREVCECGVGGCGHGSFKKERDRGRPSILAPRQEQRFGNGHFRGELLQKGFPREERAQL